MGRPPLRITDRGDTFVVRGNAWWALTEAGIKPFYCGGCAMGFVVDRRRLGDLCAFLDSRHVPYRLKRGDIDSPPQPLPLAPREPVRSAPARDIDGQLALFEGGAA